MPLQRPFFSITTRTYPNLLRTRARSAAGSLRPVIFISWHTLSWLTGLYALTFLRTDLRGLAEVQSCSYTVSCPYGVILANLRPNLLLLSNTYAALIWAVLFCTRPIPFLHRTSVSYSPRSG